MARHLSVGSVIEKNKINSEAVYLILIDAIVKDNTGAEVETVRFVKNSENITFGGHVYTAANFEFDISVENNSEPSIKLTAQDQTGALMQYVETYDGMIGSSVKMTVINSGDLSGTPEMQETFKVTSTGVDKYVIGFDLGTESAVAKRFPQYRQYKSRCVWRYKGPRCRYAGPMGSCDFTADGPNGCSAHNNLRNFGGFLGLNPPE